MSDLVPIPIDDAVRAALDDSAADLTVCLFGSSVEVLADDALEHALRVAVEAVTRQSSGSIDVTVVVENDVVDVRITGAHEDGADDAELAYVRRLVDRYDGTLTMVDDGVVIRLLRV